TFFLVNISADISVAIVWHQHQPDYKDDGVYKAPWVRLHAIKDYYDMVYVLEEHPSLRLNINLVPSLLKQIEDYVYNGAEDEFILLMKKSPHELTADEKRFILERSFDINWDNVIKKYPVYYEFLKRRGEDTKVIDQEVMERFTESDYRDLLVWFNLAWFDPGFHDRLSYFFSKKRGFSDEDVSELIGIQYEIMTEIIPLHRKMQFIKKCELMTSPYYHPILPLIYNTEEAAVSYHGLDLPEKFSYPQDALTHVFRSRSFMFERFGRYPQGMWPAEGAVSPSVIPVFRAAGVEYIATDEAILEKSLGIRIKRDKDGIPLNPEHFYRPFKVYGSDRKSIDMIFRDKVLSDRIGFDYSHISPQAAVADLKDYLDTLSERLPEDQDWLVSIILDGENAWENYDNDAKAFFKELYDFLERDSYQTVLISDFLERTENFGKIGHLWSGSWISSDFTTWIGEKEENTAWNMLGDARKMFEKNSRQLTEAEYAKAHELMLKAEGSDWFWWYGKDQESSNDMFFDRMFRNTLEDIYLTCGETIPQNIKEPIIRKTPESENRLKKYFTPVVDGLIEDEWENAYSVTVGDNRGVMKKSRVTLDRIYYTTYSGVLYIAGELSEDIPEKDISLYTDGREVSKSDDSFYIVKKGRSFEMSMESECDNFRIALRKGEEFLYPGEPVHVLYAFEDIVDWNVIIRDASGDDHGSGDLVYPEAEVFTEGDFDLEEFRYGYDDRFVYFLIKTRNMDNPWASPSGVSKQVFDIYISGREKTGKDSKLLEGRNAYSESRYLYALSLEGWEQTLHITGKDSVRTVKAVDMETDPVNGDVLVKVSRKYFPADESYGFIVGVSGQDGMSDSKIRKITEKRSEWTFGGGHAGVSSFIDIIDSGDQSEILSERPVVIPFLF
ncbi:MAG: glucodextranase DOMON-like domain-containing protein, partial [Candidatus Muiribacteriaceae bacterium]